MFPNAAALKNNAALGRLNVSSGRWQERDGTAYETIHAYGGRSFSLWSAETGTSSGTVATTSNSITSQALPANFNSNNDEDNFDARSDDKGPEPEGIAVGEFGDRLRPSSAWSASAA